MGDTATLGATLLRGHPGMLPMLKGYVGTARSADTLRLERDCSGVEFFVRRLFSSLLYWRLYRRWYPDRPFYTPAAIRRITRLFDHDSAVFEWGSGVSTVWWARRVQSLTTIEHDEGWRERVEKWLRDEGLSTANLRLIPRRDDSLADYCSAIEAFPDSSFDLIAVDGRERVACVKRAIPKLRRGGWLLLDDSHRPRYREAFDELREFQASSFDFGLLQTTLFHKP